MVRLVRISSVYETAPVDAPPHSPDFLNMAVSGLSRLGPQELLEQLLAIEARLGRVRRGRNAPRVIDLDLVLFGARRIRTSRLVVPHPRFRERQFVLAPMGEVVLPRIVSAAG